MNFEYPVKLTPAEKFAKDETGFVVTCRDLPEVITQGEDREDALREAADAMDVAFAGRIKDGDVFPVPSKARRDESLVSPPVEMVAKAALYTAMRTAGVSNVALAKRLGIDEKEVRRMLDPRHGSKIGRIAEAVEALGGRVVIQLSEAYEEAFWKKALGSASKAAPPAVAKRAAPRKSSAALR